MLRIDRCASCGLRCACWGAVPRCVAAACQDADANLARRAVQTGSVLGPDRHWIRSAASTEVAA